MSGLQILLLKRKNLLKELDIFENQYESLEIEQQIIRVDVLITNLENKGRLRK